ncbi:MAG: hypothetical protein ACOX6E_09230 [Syntrophomonadaceae bacterium]
MFYKCKACPTPLTVETRLIRDQSLGEWKLYRSGRAAKRLHLSFGDDRRIMKQYKYLFKQCVEEKTIRKAYANLRKGKTKRKAIKHIDAHLDEYIKKMQMMLKNSHPGAEHPELGFMPPKKRKPRVIFENGKERTLYMPGIIEQWVHHIIIIVFGPIVQRHSYTLSCGSMPDRGPPLRNASNQESCSKR